MKKDQTDRAGVSENQSATSRRGFIRSTGLGVGLAGITALGYGRIAGANDRLQVAVMGVKSRGQALISSLYKAGCDIATLCDVDSDVLASVADGMTSKGLPAPRLEKDIRSVLDDPAIDAVAIATPDHWHAPAAIMALQAGKHVYVEKPCGHNGREGEWLVEAQQKYGHVVQMGNQQRSAPETIELMAAIHAGELGEVYEAYTWYGNNRGGIGNGQVITPPDRLDWDLWQGPAPRTDYRDNLVHYNWHWFWHWGTGETCNNAAHELDVARWAMGVSLPEQVQTFASRRFFTDDDWQMYDTMHLDLIYSGGRKITWEGHSCNRIEKYGRSRGTQLLGTKGTAIVDRSGYQVFGLDGRLIRERLVEAASADAADLIGADHLTDLHAVNFVETIRGQASVQSSPIDEGAISTLLCHLGNLSYRSGESLEMDPQTGRPVNAAAMDLWEREYQNGWEIKV